MMQFNFIMPNQEALLIEYLKIYHEEWSNDREANTLSCNQRIKNYMSNWLYYGYNGQGRATAGLSGEIKIIFEIKTVSKGMPFYLTSLTIPKALRGNGFGILWFKEFLDSEIGKCLLQEGLYLDCSQKLYENIYSKLGFCQVGHLPNVDVIICGITK